MDEGMEDRLLSLDEIIKRNRATARANRNPAVGRIRAGATAPGPVAGARRNQRKHVRDARDIIRQRTRQKIKDARDKLNQTLHQPDTRYRLRGRDNEYEPQSVIYDNGGAGRTTTNRKRRRSRPPSLKFPSSSYAGSQYIPRPLTSYMNVEDGIDLDERHFISPEHQPPTHRLSPQTPPRRVSPQPINRIIINDAYTMPSTMPPLPNFRAIQFTEPPLSVHRPTSVVDLRWSDPFRTFEQLRHTTAMSVPPAPLPVSAMMPAASMAAPPLRGILRHRSRSPPESELPQLSANIHARLERAPNPAESMGIFSSPETSSRPPLPPIISFPPSPPGYRPETGYRIVVSNLASQVVYQDIKDLFEDIGEMMEARLVRPGVAEVIYQNLRDAEKAVEAYHNRNLDGQPMNCLLVHPRASNKPTAPALSTVRYATL